MTKEQARLVRLAKYYSSDMQEVRDTVNKALTGPSIGPRSVTIGSFTDTTDMINTLSYVTDFYELQGWNVSVEIFNAGGNRLNPIAIHETTATITLQ